MNHFAETLDLIPVACYRLNSESVVTYANKQALLHFNKSTKDCIGRNIWELFPESKVTLSLDAINTALKSGQVTTHDYVSAVTHRWLRLTAIPANDGVVVSFVDIHDLKQAEHKEELPNSVYENFIQRYG